MKDDIYLFSSPGIATIVMTKEKASSSFTLQRQREEASNENIDKVAQLIKEELNDMPFINSNYTSLNTEELMRSSSQTLYNLLSSISPNFYDNHKTVSLISSMIRTVTNKKVSMLQVGLGLQCHEKKLIDQLHEYGVTCSYLEVRQFRISAA